ncbi:MAG: class I SAM-dependent methyltransferase [Planctomycetota bacterium]|nr:MAG: class I SAM-dependent methyltransferase [Planctomycetota bacterium]
MNFQAPQHQNRDILETFERFSKKDVAQKYQNRFQSTKRDRREKKAILKLLRGIPKSSKILDIPCGTGRITRFLYENGYQVVGADSSESMIQIARSISSKDSISLDFEIQNLFSTTYPDHAFDVLVCNRFFHHLYNSSSRVTALKELARITKGPIILSFFYLYSFSGLISFCKKKLFTPDNLDRIPISLKTLEKDIQNAGLAIREICFTRFLISPQTYLKLEKSQS